MKQFEEGKLYRSKKGVLFKCTKVFEKQFTVRHAEFTVAQEPVIAPIESYALKTQSGLDYFEEWYGHREDYHDEFVESEFGVIHAGKPYEENQDA